MFQLLSESVEVQIFVRTPGVPDSLLRPLCDYLMNQYGTDPHHHIIAANEGNCTALAAGYHLATGKVPVVYMQNSGEGNMINPAASLLNKKVYAIPVIFVIGWRGQPGIHDEPQHIYQGEITLKLLEDMDIPSYVISDKSSYEEVAGAMRNFRGILNTGRSVAFVICKGALTYQNKAEYINGNMITREKALQYIAETAGEDLIISTTGKISRELFEIREANGQSHSYDFLTVGSMGHCSSIAYAVAVNKPDIKVWCVDGDGAALMHMGAMAMIGTGGVKNLIHIVINNGAHDTVGGMPTTASQIHMAKVAKACGYSNAVCVDNFENLNKELKKAKHRKDLSFIEIKCSMGSREDLGRPTISTQENKIRFMEYVKSL